MYVLVTMGVEGKRLAPRPPPPTPVNLQRKSDGQESFARNHHRQPGRSVQTDTGQSGPQFTELGVSLERDRNVVLSLHVVPV